MDEKDIIIQELKSENHRLREQLLKLPEGIEAPKQNDEVPKLSKRERTVCELLGTGYIVRDDLYNSIMWSNREPRKYEDEPFWTYREYTGLQNANLGFLGVEFAFIKWTDHEPWRVEDLLKLEVDDASNT